MHISKTNKKLISAFYLYPKQSYVNCLIDANYTSTNAQLREMSYKEAYGRLCRWDTCHTHHLEWSYSYICIESVSNVTKSFVHLSLNKDIGV